MAQTVRLAVLGTFVLGMPALAVLSEKPWRRPTATTSHASHTSQAATPLATTAEVTEELTKQSADRVSPPTQNTSSHQTPLPFHTDAEQARAERLQRQLVACGATMFVLEFDQHTHGFVARCRVPLPTAENLTKVFQASDPMPLTAMQSVLEQVQQWKMRVARIQATRTK